MTRFNSGTAPALRGGASSGTAPALRGGASLRVVGFAFMLGVVALASGCFNRQLLRFQTHEQKPVVLMETLDTTDYWLWSDHEHVFWSCAESGDALNCSRRCGKDSGLDCPALSIFTNQVGSNAR